MHRLAQTCALLVTVGWATPSLGAAAMPELICDPTIQNRCAPVSKLLDAGYGLQVTCDNCGSTGSGPGGGLTNTELRATPVPIGFDGGAVTSYQGGTWTVAANAGTNLNTSALATQAGQTDGTAKAIARGGAKGATAAADITGTAEGTDHQAIDAQLYSGGTAYKGLVSGDAVDVNDRAARLLGKADVLVGAAAPSATNPLFVRLTDGTTAYVGFKSGDVIGALPAGGALIGAVKFSQTTTDNDVDVLTLPALAQLPSALVGGRLDENVGAWLGSTAPTVGSKTSANSIPVVIASDQAAVPASQSGTWTNRIVGNAGGVLDSANNAAPPANVLAIGYETIASGTQPTAATSTNARRPEAGLDGVAFARLGGPVTWTCGLSALAATATSCKAAPGAGLKLYVTDVLVNTTTATAGTWNLQSAPTTCGTSATAVLPAANTTDKYTAPLSTAQPQFIPFQTPIALAANTPLCAIGTATNTINITVSGYTAP